MRNRTGKWKAENDRKEKELDKGGQKMMLDIVNYLKVQDLRPDDMERIRGDIIDMLSDAQKRGEPPEKVFGSDYRSFCGRILENVDHMDPDEKLRRNAGLVLSCWPLIGLFLSDFNVLLQILKGKEWTLGRIPETLAPFFMNLVILLLCMTLFGRYLTFSMPYMQGRWKFATFGIIVLFPLLHVILYLM